VRLSDRPEALLYGQRAYRRAVHIDRDPADRDQTRD
jgi:hypothetical protein